MNLTPDQLEDLRWYFSGEAEAAAGVRSVQGGFEDTMNRLAMCGRAEAGQMPVHESRSTHAVSDDAIERLHGRTKSIARARAIFARVRLLAKTHRVVLELQFGDAEMSQGVSVAMLCQTDRVKAAVQKVNARRVKKGRGPISGREAVLALSRSKDGDDLAALRDMAAEAMGAVRAALAAYAETI